MSCLHIGIREQRVRYLVDQLPDNQHKLDRYVEIGENCDMLQPNIQAFKALNLTANKNSIDAIKHTKVQLKHVHIVA